MESEMSQFGFKARRGWLVIGEESRRYSHSKRLCHSERSRGMERLGKPRHRRAGRRPSERAANEPIS